MLSSVRLGGSTEIRSSGREENVGLRPIAALDPKAHRCGAASPNRSSAPCAANRFRQRSTLRTKPPRLGFGLVQMPRYHAEAALTAREFVEVLTDFPPSLSPVSILYPDNRQLSPACGCFEIGWWQCSEGAGPGRSGTAVRAADRTRTWPRRSSAGACAWHPRRRRPRPVECTRPTPHAVGCDVR